MDVRAIRALVEADEVGDLDGCRRELAAARQVRAMLDARVNTIVRRLNELRADTEGELAAASMCSAAAAAKANRRAAAAAAVPGLQEGLAAGETTAGHVDAVADALAGLAAADRRLLLARAGEIRAKAAAAAEPAFRSWLSDMVRRLRRDPPATRLEQQKEARRLRWWLDAEGLWNLRARFDPESGIAMQAALRAAVERLFHGGVPAGAPLDLLERQQWLQALALAALVVDRPAGAGGYGAGGTAEAPANVVVVIDGRTFLHGEHEHSRVDLGRFGLPVDTIRRWACSAEVTPVIVGADGTRLLLGRTARLANRDQRRALRAWYRTCACCDVPFDHCAIHHVSWFDEHGGTTDIDNLLPLCSRHHHLAHEGGWQLTVLADRTLRVRLPDGQVMVHAPPRARAA